MDLETLACHLIELLARRYPQALAERYKLEADPGLPGWELLELCGKSGASGSLAARWTPSAWRRCFWTSTAPASWET